MRFSGIGEFGADRRVVRDLLEGTVPRFSLTDLDRLGDQQITVPVMSAVTSLPTTIAFTVYSTDQTHFPAQFTLTNDFIDEPVVVLSDAQIPSFPAAHQ